MYCSLLPWLPASVSTCCNLTVVGWLAHFHKAIKWDTNELSQDTVDNTRVLDSDTLPPHVNQPAAVSFPHRVSVILCFWEEGTKNIEGSITNQLSNCFLFLLFYSVKYGKSHGNQALITRHHSCYCSMGSRWETQSDTINNDCQLSIKSSEVSGQIVNSSLLTWNVSVSDSLEDILLIPVEWALALLRWLRLYSLVLSSTNLPSSRNTNTNRRT